MPFQASKSRVFYTVEDIVLGGVFVYRKQVRVHRCHMNVATSKQGNGLQKLQPN